MEDHPPDIPNPPPLSFQEHDAPLGSSSVGPTHSYQQSLPSRQRHYKAINQPPTSAAISEGEDGEVGSEQNLLYLPSSSQQAALTALQDHDDTTIFAWLTGLRCAANWFQPGCLSPQQLEAISALKECSNSLISTWLDSIRCGGNTNALHGQHGNGYLDAQRAAVTSTRSTLQGSSHTSGSSASSFGVPTSLYDNRTSASTQRSSFGKGSFLDLSGDPAALDETAATLPSAAGHTHWCFVCDNHRVYTTCDGWKRHMKEHETRYPCMPRGREIYTAYGPECVLCGDLNPDERHYILHNIQSCSNKTLAARSYTRKIHLINHLKTHGVSDGSALAEEWRDTLDKKYFSCGFCIAYFHSHADQLNHIHNLHYKNHQHISAWESNKVILGLLLQPAVHESWRNVLAVHSQFNESRFRWTAATVKKLQLRLQKSEETAGNLALAAFNESTYNWTQETHGESMSVADFSNQDVSSNHDTPTIRCALPAQMLFGPDQGTIYQRGMTTTQTRGQHPAWRSSTTHQLNPSVPNINPTTYQNNSSRKLLTTNRIQDRRDVQLGLSSSSSNGWAPLGSPRYAPLQWSIPQHSDTYDGQSSMPRSPAGDGDWHASSPKSLSAYFGGQENSGAGRTRTTVATQHTASSFDHLTSPVARPSSSFCRSDPSSLPIRPTKQPSRTKLKGYYDIDTEADMDIDLDDIQYYMREEEHTRSEGLRR